LQLTELFLAELDREGNATRRVLERVPEGRNDWKPHDKSMRLGYLAALVARLPGWSAMIVNRDEFDLNGPDGEAYKPLEQTTNGQLLRLFDDSVQQARTALASTNDEHLITPWKFLVNGHLVSDLPRHVMLRDTVFNHLAHHRGQLTVYLRLNSVEVPGIYGPSADEKHF
jgi:uncharacterized damage-inducible protein DinB